ncbi:hypothetical protein FNP_0003 [Fusobacterium polymorphum ATCC 10953]|uniref:Uncharacterized protein n=1 Tax=Fusobacterium polymorphum ATCC 10953 TaxID=393480 RepID=A5TSE7_FUSNP|nr:hypothetical protein FNP_0003 [Fusobacterium polymorphum ATCC 10953]
MLYVVKLKKIRRLLKFRICCKKKMESFLVFIFNYIH